MNVPTVKEYPAINQLNIPGLVMSKLCPMMSSGDRQAPKAAWVMNWAIHTTATKTNSCAGRKECAAARRDSVRDSCASRTGSSLAEDSESDILNFDCCEANSQFDVNVAPLARRATDRL